MNKYSLYCGHATEIITSLPCNSVQCVVTSPPYWKKRNYDNNPKQIGQEPSPVDYVKSIVNVFADLWPILKDDGVVWLNLGDTYCSTENRPRNGEFKPKDLIGIPWMTALALRDAGWYLRADIIWHKPNGLPSPAKDRVSIAHEYIFMLTKSERYYYDRAAVGTPLAPASIKRYTHAVEHHETFDPSRHKSSTNGRAPMEIVASAAKGVIERGYANLRSVWKIPTKNHTYEHEAPMPDTIPMMCIKASSRRGDVVLDPFNGTGTTGIAALKLGREYWGIDCVRKYIAYTEKQLSAITSTDVISESIFE